MKSIFRRRPTPAMGIALVALFVALSGTAVALPGKRGLDSNDPKTGSIGTRAIANNSVRAADIRTGNVRSSDVLNDSLLSEDVKDDTLGGNDINESALGTVPSASNANNLGGVAASRYQRTLRVITRSVTGNSVANGGTSVGIANCAAGERATGGGGFLPGAVTQPSVVNSYPSTFNSESPAGNGSVPRAWTTRIYNTGPLNGPPAAVTAYVVCVSP